MIFCSFCLAPVLKSSWDVHCSTCRPILGRTEKPTLTSNHLHPWEMWIFVFLLEKTDLLMKIDFLQPWRWPKNGFGVGMHRQRCGTPMNEKTRMVFCRDLAFSHLLVVEFATRPWDVQPFVDLCNRLCEFFNPLLAEMRVDLPSKLLQLRHKEILLRRLCTYDEKTKVPIIFL